jgi:excisionase family DNA binding protein
MKVWMTVGEGAEYAGVSRDTLYTACERREMRHARVGGRRAIRVKAEWIDAWYERHARRSDRLWATAGDARSRREGEALNRCILG